MGGAWQVRARSGLSLLLLPALACASAPAPAPPPPATPPSAEAIAALAAPAPVRLMWLPVDTVIHPRLGPAINQQLLTARLPGLAAHDRAPVSMDTAQLSLECSQPTPQCHGAVGRHLKVNRLLWAEVQRQRRKAVVVSLFLYDVDAATMAARAERRFASEQAALAQLQSLMAELTSAATVASAPTSQAGATAP